MFPFSRSRQAFLDSLIRTGNFLENLFLLASTVDNFTLPFPQGGRRRHVSAPPLVACCTSHMARKKSVFSSLS